MMLAFYVFLLTCLSPIWSSLQMHHIKNAKARLASCNDGTDAAYYIEIRDPSPGSRWLIHLQGGGGCYDVRSCEIRSETSLTWQTTSAGIPKTIEFGGTFSRDCDTNPTFCQANVVYAHYCSSDWWSGNSSAHTTLTGPFEFRGKAVVHALLEDLLLSFPALKSAGQVVLSGSSAGGVGSWSNSDDVGVFFHKHLGSAVDYRVMSDVGWFLDGPGLRPYECETDARCNFETRLRTGSPMWGLVPHKACGKHFEATTGETWRCLVGHRVYPFVAATKMAFVYQFDMWQVEQDGVGSTHAYEMSDKEQEWVLGRGKQVVETLEKDNATAHGVFAPGCIDHVMLPYVFTQGVKTNDGATVSDAVRVFVERKGVPVHIDKCDSLYCNSNCLRF